MVIAFASVFLGILFIQLDSSWENSCALSHARELDTRNLIACINAEIYDPFIWILSAVWLVAMINGGTELLIERKKK